MGLCINNECRCNPGGHRGVGPGHALGQVCANRMQVSAVVRETRTRLSTTRVEAQNSAQHDSLLNSTVSLLS